jgi:hypothetical protein
MKSTSRVYKKTKYPKKTIKLLCYLELCSGNLDNLLESYRYLQPEGGAFSSKTIEKIFSIHQLNERIAEHNNEIAWHQGIIERFQYERDCIEKGINIIEESLEAMRFHNIFNKMAFSKKILQK